MKIDLHLHAKERSSCSIATEKQHIEAAIKFGLDAIEIHSTNIGKDDSKAIEELAKRLNTRLISNSDGHNFKHVGIYYNDIEGNPETDTELIELLKSGKYKHSCFNPMRVEEFNTNVRKNEKIIKELIKENKDKKYYHELTGNWEGEFDRVAMGKSYEI